MENKVIITEYANDVNQWLLKGWVVKSVTAQMGVGVLQGGKFAFVLEKTSNDFR